MAYFHLGRGVVLPTLTITHEDIDFTTTKGYLWVWTSSGWERWDASNAYRRTFSSEEAARELYDLPVTALSARVACNHSQTGSKTLAGSISLRILYGYPDGSDYEVFAAHAAGGGTYSITAGSNGSNGSAYTEHCYGSPFGFAFLLNVSAAGTSGDTFELHMTPMFIAA